MYDIDYFIKKFEAIPEENWICGIYGKGYAHCTVGHCYDGRSYIENPQVEPLFSIFGKYPFAINDGYDKNYQQPTPKQRILAALYDKKAEMAVKEAQEIVNTEQLELV